MHGRAKFKAPAAIHMQQTVRHRIVLFLLARFILFHLLIEEAQKKRPENHCHLWFFTGATDSDMGRAPLKRWPQSTSTEETRNQIKDEYSKLRPMRLSVVLLLGEPPSANSSVGRCGPMLCCRNRCRSDGTSWHRLGIRTGATTSDLTEFTVQNGGAFIEFGQEPYDGVLFPFSRRKVKLLV
jgi:hypothetical protein